MSDIPKDIQEVLNKVYEETSPVSIFLYGSRARKDFVKESDWEIGLLYLHDKKWSRSDLAAMHKIKNLRLYPFTYEEFIVNNLDTPFPKTIYMWSLTMGARTLFGDKVVESLKLPDITLIDLLEEAVFQIARAYSAMLSFRQKDMIGSSEGFVKSVLFGTRVYLILETKSFPMEYTEITRSSSNLDLNDEYKLLIKHALDVRNGQDLDQQMLFKNISFLNQLVIKRIKEELQNGNRIVLQNTPRN